MTEPAKLEIPEALREEWAAISHGAVEIIPAEELVAKLVKAKAAGKPLRVKLGADPSAPDLHIGHAVVLRKLRQFQDFGHQVVFIIGDATGRIGDPTGRSETRPQLTDEQVRANAETYFEQAYKILDPARTEVVYNGSWFSKMTFDEVVRLMAQSTVARMLERDDFQKRHSEGLPIHMHEFLYPLMQGWDSVMVRSDIEIGGTDQKFNLLVGRQLQASEGQAPQCILTMPLLAGLDGVRKMSKSLGNHIAFGDAPEDMFGKAMSIGDDQMADYFRLALYYPDAEARRLTADAATGKIHPRELKARLARELTALYHDENAAREAEEHFNRVHRDHERPAEVEEAEIEISDGEGVFLFAALVQTGLAPSGSEAKRLIRGGGVRIGEQRVSDEALKLGRGSYDLQVGKRRFLKLTLT